MITINCFLILSALMLFIGVYGFLTRRNTLAILISIELMLNAASTSLLSTVCCSPKDRKAISLRCSQ